jgi:hypothetical protein
MRCAVPIAPFPAQGTFCPEETRAMGVAFQNACQTLGVIDVTDPMTKMVAAKIIEVAKAGERDPVKLHEAVMRWAARAA